MNILVCFKFRVAQWQKLIVPADKKATEIEFIVRITLERCVTSENYKFTTAGTLSASFAHGPINPIIIIPFAAEQNGASG